MDGDGLREGYSWRGRLDSEDYFRSIVKCTGVTLLLLHYIH